MVQPIDLSEFPNSSGWQVVHDPDNMTYIIKSEKGHIKEGRYTHRAFAEKALYDYLNKMAKPVKKVIKQKENDNT